MPDIRISPMGQLGLNSDLGPSVLDPKAITKAQNVETHESALKSSRGEIKLFDLELEPLYHYAHIDINGHQWLIVSDGVKVHAYRVDGVYEDITPEGGDLNYAICTIDDLNGVLLFNSNEDGLYYWPGSGETLKQWPGMGDDNRTWFLDESDPPEASDGEDGDYWQDAYHGIWYAKAEGVWSPDNVGNVIYGWRWDLDWKCESIESYRYFVVALSMSESGAQLPYKVRWSTSSEEGAIPVEWRPRAENEAGSDLLGETEGRIIGGTKVRDALFVIKEDAVYTCQWIGGEYVMQFQRLQGTIGTNILGGFSEVQGQLAVFTSTDLLSFSGSEQTSLTDNVVRNALFDTLDETYWNKCTIYYHQPTGILYVAFVAAGNEALTDCLLYNSFDKSWGHKKLHASYGFDTAFVTVLTERATYNSLDLDGMMTICEFDPVTGEATICTEVPIPGWEEPEPVAPAPRWEGQAGKTYDELVNFSYNKGVYQPSVPDAIVYESNLNDPEVDDVGRKYWVSLLALSHVNSDGTPKECIAERHGIPIEAAKGRFLVNEVWVESEGDGEFYLDVGVSDTPGGTVHWTSSTIDTDEFGMLVSPSTDAPLDPMIEGRYLAWKLYSRTTGSWALHGLTFKWEATGAH